MQTSIGVSHAKIILMGEHAVVYHQPAIALPIKAIRLTATLRPQPKDQMIASTFYSGSLRAAAKTRFAGIAQLIRQLLRFFDAEQQGFMLTIASELPAERGMGSSAATAVAIVRAFYQAFGQALPREILLNWASVSEKLIHGNPSGLDAATTSASHPQWFIKNQKPKALRLPPEGVLVIADTGTSGHTGEAVGQVAALLQGDKDYYQPEIAAIGNLVKVGALALAQDDLVTLGHLMTTNQQHLKTLGVSTPALDHLVDVAEDAGALGAKLTGSGLGGCMIALAKDVSTAQKVAAALTGAGAKETWVYDFSTKDDGQ
ncbi:mevalonate kinase [Lacticaseibacillus brantae]|nr:mevalonate kinase [Lacticaseibacillus brantae]